MRIILKTLTLENFKGVRKFILDTGDKSVQVNGENGAGKTTLMDAFLWLLFGKDSQGKADFAIKTLDSKGQEIHNLNHSVEARLEIDGKNIILKKVLSEKWTKKRGSAQATFTGHTTEYFIEGVPIQEKEYKARINQIIAEDTFKLLTSPTFFNSLPWQKRREILLQVCGDVSDGDVIAADRDLASLPEIIGNRSMEDHKKVIAAKKKQINDRLREIPARIDELNKSLMGVSDIDIAATQARILELTTLIEGAKADGGMAMLRVQKAELTAKLREIEGVLDQKKRDAEKETVKQIEALEEDQRKGVRELQRTSNESAILTDTIEKNEKQMDYLRRQFVEISGQEYAGVGTCPTCGQTLPEDQAQAALEKHNQAQARKLAEINEQGLKLKTATEEAKDRLKFETVIKRDTLALLTMLETKIKLAKEQKTVALEAAGKIEVKAIADLKEEILEVEGKLSAAMPENTAPWETEKANLQTKLAQVEAAKTTKTRIKELTAEEKALAGEYENLERQTYLIEKFTVAKVNLLEGKINSRFRVVKWKLFETQINGGIQEICEALYNGTPVSSGASTGESIIVGLDIISTLQEYYGVNACIWIDHRESLTLPVKMDCQTISLVASETPEGLTVIRCEE